jgi:hypothetical protein
MTYSAEFIVSVGQYEHVKLKASGETWDEFRSAINDMVLNGAGFGDDHASLKAAVLYGRDQAVLNAKLAAGIEEARSGQTRDLGDFSKYLNDDSPEELIKSELGATVIETVTHDTPKEPWKRPQKAAAPKVWESGPAAPAKPAQQGMEDF